MYPEVNRIINSTAFRRMQDKTQFYYSYKGDHYRTRLTHSIEVMMIAERIAVSLLDTLKRFQAKNNENISLLSRKCWINNIDVALTRSIALLHDIGHTPFGHIGERTLSSILCGKDNLGDLISINIKRSCFKHNINSLRLILESLSKDERKTLPWQIFDGVCKHTSVTNKDNSIGDDPYRINSLIVNTPLNNLTSVKYSQHSAALSIEGQIVAIADEIAQRISDFDDMVRAGDFNNACFDLIDGLRILKENFADRLDVVDEQDILYIEDVIGDSRDNSIVRGQKELFEKINEIILRYTKHNADGTKEVKHEDVIPNLQTFLINEVVSGTIKNLFAKDTELSHAVMKDNSVLQGSMVFVKSIDEVSKSKKASSLIAFGTIGEKVNGVFENLSSNQVIPSYEIRRCDSISSHIIRQLFKAYYNDPSQMSDKSIRDIFTDVIDYCNRNNKLILKSVICEFNKQSLYDSITNVQNERDFRETLKELEKCVKQFNALPENNSEEIPIKEKRENGVKKHIGEIYLRHIAYYIAGMTDSFALEEYKKLYGISLP